MPALHDELLAGTSKSHNVFHYAATTWADVAVIQLFVDGAAMQTQGSLRSASYAPYARVLKRICCEEDFRVPRDAALRQALRALLLAMADDDLVLGHRHSEWTGFAPDIESDVALSSIAQDEIGHAQLLYEQVGALNGTSADRLVYAREPAACPVWGPTNTALENPCGPTLCRAIYYCRDCRNPVERFKPPGDALAARSPRAGR